MPFNISTTREFAAAHQLRLYDGSMEPLHGHNWRVRVTVAADKLDSIGVVMDFHDLEKIVDRIVVPWHNTHLNEVSDFRELNPSAENVAYRIGTTVRLPESVRLSRVEVWETSINQATFIP